MNRSLILAAALGCALVAFPAHAYLDPGSGSMFLQLLLGGVAGVALAVKLYWHKILGILGLEKKQDDETPP